MILRGLLLLTLATVTAASNAESLPGTFSNPVIPGFAPDPSIVRVDDDFYLVNSTFEVFPGIPIYHSRDLVNWELISYALRDPDQVDLDTIASGGGVHASTIRHHDGVFYIITTNVRNGQPINFIVTAEDPRGPWSRAHVLEGAPGIDPSLLFDDGRVWYTGNRAPPDPDFEGQGEIWLQEVDIEQMKLIGERHFLWRGCCGGLWAEGPHIYKKDGYYYLLIAEGGTSFNHSVAVAISRDITGPYQSNPRNPVLTHRHLSNDFPISGVGHADLVELKDGRWYAVALGWRLVDGRYGILGRETFLLPVTWETEPEAWKDPQHTWPVFSPETGRVELHFPTPFPETVQQPFTEFVDRFEQPELGLEWNFRRTRKERFHSLTERPGFLQLALQPGAIGERAQYSFAGIRQRHFRFQTSTVMDFTPGSGSEEAGLTLMQNDRGVMLMTLSGTEDQRRLTLYRWHNGERAQLAQAAVEPGRIHLRIKGDYLRFGFDYSTNGQTWTPLASGVDGTFLSPSELEGFNYTGLYVGLYASSNGADSDNAAVFDEFRYAPRRGDRDHWFYRQSGDEVIR